MSASAAHTWFGAGLYVSHKHRPDDALQYRLHLFILWYLFILLALHRCKFNSSSTLQTPWTPEKAYTCIKWAQNLVPTHFFPYPEKPMIPLSFDSSILLCHCSQKMSVYWAMLGWTVITNYTDGLSLLMGLLVFTISARWQRPAHKNSLPCS